MRVISGKYKGRKIIPPNSDNIRPTTDKVKEAIFAILQPVIEDAVVIDLFAGTGGLGVEGLSRGAKKVYFCDGASASIELLKQNTAFLEKGSYEILRGDYYDSLKRLQARGIKANIVLCDPPYGKKIPEKALQALYDLDILEKNATVVVERKTVDEVSKKYFALVNQKTFGETSLDVYKNVSKCAVTGSFDPFTLGHKFVVESALKEYGFCYVVILVNEEKQARYSVETRKRMIALSLGEYKKRIRIDYYQGMTVDYCKENGLTTIYRGYRNETDEKYEREMADYNKTHGNVDTVIVKAEMEISSSTVKQMYDEGQEVYEYVAPDVVGLLRKR